MNKILQVLLSANENPANKIVLILGSGFHAEAFGSDSNQLMDWGKLLKEVEPRLYLTKDYIVDFETIIKIRTLNQRPRNKYASQIEREVLKKVSEKILSVKIDRTKQFYPLEIFNSNYVSDVISLNFDTIPERLLSGNSKFKCHYAPFTSKEKLKEDERNALLYHQVEDIKFWHPHGTVEKPSSILLGMRRYGQRIKMVERLRKHYKSKSKDGSLEIEASNWYDLLTTRPIIICGASLSNAEWDIWTALVNRSRNYARYPKREQPIYIMTDNPGMYEARNPDNVNYFIPITSKKESFAAQWSKLEELFKV
jgi:hypothetical protein